MKDILYLSHRIPFPPNKGDKIRSYHQIRHLSKSYRIHLGTFVDDPRDAVHVPELEKLCTSVLAVPLNPRLAKLKSLRGLFTGQPLSLPYYFSSKLRQWVERTISEHHIHRAMVFSSPMVQYIESHKQLRPVIDFCDVDSAKWTQYSREASWPIKWIYAREGRQLLAYEKHSANLAQASLFATPAEVKLFQELAPGTSGLHGLGNGVDAEFFRPNHDRISPFAEQTKAIVFTGVMDYLPNVDAVTWFANEAFPLVLQAEPNSRFFIVGMNPNDAVRRLANQEGIVVTGSVEDVRPYLQHAAAVVAPLRIARGIQNKVLEAMSMARPVVVASAPAAGILGVPGIDFETADSADEFAQKVIRVMKPSVGEAMGKNSRERVLKDYDWTANLNRLVDMIEASA